MPRLVLYPVLTTLLSVCAATAFAVETISFKDKDGNKRDVIGEILVEATDGFMLRGDDSRIWMVTPEQLVSRESDEQALVPIGEKEMENRLRSEFDGFQVLRTDDYVIAFNCDVRYAKKVGGLFQQLHRKFFAYWSNQHLKLSKPRFPLVAVVLRDRESFLEHARAEIGDMADSVIGYYDFASNRMTTYNVQHDWERNIATIIHEATHQLAYNSGLQTRFADNPLWVSEGLATFFEVPDMRRRGTFMGNIGDLNLVNAKQWKAYRHNRKGDSLRTLLADDSRFLSVGTRKDAYCEAWAFTYFVMKTKARRKDYVAYLKALSDGKPLAKLTAGQRISMFEESFNASVEEVDAQFMQFMGKLFPIRVQIGVRPLR